MSAWTEGFCCGLGIGALGVFFGVLLLRLVLA